MRNLMIVIVSSCLLSVVACGERPEVEPCSWLLLNGEWGSSLTCQGGSVHLSATRAWESQGAIRSPWVAAEGGARVDVWTRGSPDLSTTWLDSDGGTVSQRAILPAPRSGGVQLASDWVLDAPARAAFVYVTVSVQPDAEAWLDRATITALP